MAVHQKNQGVGETRDRERESERERERSVGSVCVCVCVFFRVRPKCVGGQPSIMSASKTRALMAAVCLQGGLLHTTVLQKQRQIYKATIRKREKINQNAIKVE